MKKKRPYFITLEVEGVLCFSFYFYRCLKFICYFLKNMHPEKLPGSDDFAAQFKRTFSVETLFIQTGAEKDNEKSIPNSLF